MEEPVSILMVKEYYGRIDREDVDWVISRFREDAVYERADASYDGIEEISRFFREQRLIRGVHSVDTLIANAEGDIVVAAGRFTGKGKAGDTREVGFADIWHFDGAGRVKKRQTFLALGNAYVRE